MFGLSELALLLIIAIVLISARKLPGLARSAGRAARILRSEAKAIRTGPGVPADGRNAPHIVRATPGAPSHEASRADHTRA